MRQVQAFPDGAALLEHCAAFGLEGVVGKRIDKPYVSGPTRYFVKVNCPTSKRADQQRFRMFEGNKKPATTEEQLKKKRAELARVLEIAESPPRHRARAQKTAGDLGAGNRGTGIGLKSWEACSPPAGTY
jgi:hypothetical protein